MSKTNVNTKIANTGETSPHYITLPFSRGFGDVPANSPQWFLAAFAAWVDSQCCDALIELRRLSFRAHETNASAVHAARRCGISRETSLPALLFGLGSLPSGEAEKLSEFFFFYLERAKHEITLVALDFFHEMALDYIPAHHFDGDRQDQFEARFAEYLDDRDYGSFKNEAWQASGLSVDDLIAEILRDAAN